MARGFDSASSEYLINSGGGSPVSGYPVTISALYYQTDSSVPGTQWLAHAGSSTEGTWMALSMSISSTISTFYAEVRNDSNSEDSASYNTGVDISGAWHHTAAVFTSSTSRTVYYDGSTGSSSTSITDSYSNLDSVAVAVRQWATGRSRYLDGNLAELAIWNAALTDAEVASLAAGYSPLLIRPANLVFYVPLIRDNDEDIVGGLSLTANGTPTVEAHPRVIYPMAEQSFFSTFVNTVSTLAPAGYPMADRPPFTAKAAASVDRIRDYVKQPPQIFFPRRSM